MAGKMLTISSDLDAQAYPERMTMLFIQMPLPERRGVLRGMTLSESEIFC
jgi:hypothetical protein